MNWRSLNWEKSAALSPFCSTQSILCHKPERKTHTYSTHRRNNDTPSVYLLCSRQLTSWGCILSQPVCDGQEDTHTQTSQPCWTGLFWPAGFSYIHKQLLFFSPYFSPGSVLKDIFSITRLPFNILRVCLHTCISQISILLLTLSLQHV